MPLKIALEVRDDLGEFSRGFDGAEKRAGGENGLHLGEVIGVVGAQIDRAARRKGRMGEGRKARIDEAVPAVFALGPGIGKINVEGGNRARGEKPFEKIGGFNAKGADVGETRALAFALELAQAAQKPLDAEKIPIRMKRGILREKGAVAAAKLDFQRLACGKETGQVQPLGDGVERGNDGRGLGQGLSRRS